MAKRDPFPTPPDGLMDADDPDYEEWFRREGFDEAEHLANIARAILSDDFPIPAKAEVVELDDARARRRSADS
jgi:hypothetical protein